MDKKLVFFAIHRRNSGQSGESGMMSENALYNAELMMPKLPIIFKSEDCPGYRFEKYNLNGWVYRLEPGEYAISIASCPDTNLAVSLEPCDFIFRARSQLMKDKQDRMRPRAEFTLFQ